MLRFICLVLDLKNSINLVLSGCRTSLLTRKNSQIFRNSILAIAIKSLIFVCVNSSVVSSANSKERNFEDVKSLINQGYKPTSSWYESMVKKLKYDRRKVNQELECKFLGSGDNVFDAEKMLIGAIY